MDPSNPLAELAPYLEALRGNDDSISPPENLTARLIATRSVPVPSENLPRDFGDYTLESILGHGSTGTVYQAYDGELDRHIAIKILAPEIAALPDARERFLREGRAAASLRHENLMTLYAVHQDTPTPCLTSPLLKGETLQQKLNRDGPLPPDEITAIATQITSALQHAHAADVLHRDIKPSNIFYETDARRAILMDFGLARSLQTPSDLTLSGTIAGTPEFLAPEQIDDDPTLTPATDLYSLGATLYTLASGKPPFSGQSLTSLLKKVALDPPAPLENIPTWLNQLVLTLLSKKPVDRPSSAREVLTLLNQKPSSKKTSRPLLKTILLIAIPLLLLTTFLLTRGKDPPPPSNFSLTNALTSTQPEITIPTSGTHFLEPFALDRDLTIKATEPNTVFVFSDSAIPITTTKNLTLENLTLRLHQSTATPVSSLIKTSGPTLHLINCRLEVPGRDPLPLYQDPIVSATSALDLQIRNTVVFSLRSPLLHAASGAKLDARNSLLLAPALLIANNTDNHHIALDQTTAVCLNLVLANLGEKKNHLVASDSHLEVNHAFLWSPDSGEFPISKTFSWKGQNNTLATTRTWFTTHPTKRRFRRLADSDPTTFETWRDQWSPHESSREVPPVIIPLDLATEYPDPSQLDYIPFKIPHPTGPDLNQIGPR